MSKRNDGGPAFARAGFDLGTHTSQAESLPQDGMTLHDWYVGQSIAGLLTGLAVGGWHEPSDFQIKRMITTAHAIADAAVEARSR